MKLKVWMAQNKKGHYLCKSHLNPLLSYYLCYPLDSELLSREDWLMCRTKREILAHLRKWRQELRSYERTSANHIAKNSFRKARCRPVKMVVSWEPETKLGARQKTDKIDSLTDWEWTTLVAAWRYYEHGHTIASATFPSDMLRRFWGNGNPYSDKVRDTIANQFAKIDHGMRGEKDWTVWLKKDIDGATLHDDCDAKVWTTFYQFCNGWVNGFVEVTARNGKVQKTVKAFYTEYTDRWTPVDGYIANPLLSPYIPKEFIVSTKGEAK